MKIVATTKRSHVREVYLKDGRRPALNFINTCKKDGKGGHIDRLTSYWTFLNWCEQTGIIDNDDWLELDVEQRLYVKDAEMAYAEAISARDCFDELFNNLANGEDIHPLILDRFNGHADKIRPHLQYRKGPNGPQLYWFGIREELNMPLWLVIADACRLIDSGEWRKIKKCPLCGSLFMDHSRSSNKRWCNPNTCGSLRKSTVYYERKISAKNKLKTA